MLIPAEHGVYLEWSTIESWHSLVQTPPTPNSHPPHLEVQAPAVHAAQPARVSLGLVLVEAILTGSCLVQALLERALDEKCVATFPCSWCVLLPQSFGSTLLLGMLCLPALLAVFFLPAAVGSDLASLSTPPCSWVWSVSLQLGMLFLPVVEYALPYCWVCFSTFF